MNSYTKKKIISLVAPTISSLGLHYLFEPVFGGLGHILTFHRVVKPDTKSRIHNHLSLEIDPVQLEQTITFYKKRGYTFLSLDEVHKLLHHGGHQKKFVAFTFDDGYRDNLEIAYPILKKHNVPFTIYVTTNFPDQKAILWWYLLEDFLIETEAVNFNHQGKEFNLSYKTQEEKEAAFDQLRHLINSTFDPTKSQIDFFKKIFQKKEEQLYTPVKKLALTWDEIKQLSKDPLCTIGAHTVNHFPLSKLEHEDLFFEIQQSRLIIEKHIGKAVEHFAYPFGKAGEANQREFEVVRALDFKTGTTTRIGNIFAAHRKFLTALPRISINRVTDKNVLTLQSSGLLPFIIHRGRKVISA